MISWILVFFGVLVLDFVWARYTIALAEKRALSAGVNAAIIFALGGFATMSYVDRPELLIPAALGAFCGTVLSVRFCDG